MNGNDVTTAIVGALALFGLAAIDFTPEVRSDTLTSCVKRLAVDSVPRGAHVGVSMDLPPAMRTKNWGGGSCVHASTVSLLKWQGQYEMADWWRETYIGGEYATRLVNRMEQAGLRYAYTSEGDMQFLEWAHRNRLGAGLFFFPAHAINFVGMDDKYVYLLDNNNVSYPEDRGHYRRIDIGTFRRKWRDYYGGFAWTIVSLSPPPPPPTW